MAHKKGFTLIELLVVIAIIALLLSILMPALKKAKLLGQTVVCRNNLKQIGMAALLYAEDHEDILPRNGGVWGFLFMPYLGSVIDTKASTTAEEDEEIPDIGTYNCPSYPDKEQRHDYVVSSWLDGKREVDDDVKKTKTSAWITPSAKVYLADNESGDWRQIVKTRGDLDRLRLYDVWKWQHLPTGPDGGNDKSNSNVRRVARARHNRGSYNKESDFNVTDNNGNTVLDNPNENIGCNYLFLDGHSDWIRANDSIERVWRPARM